MPDSPDSSSAPTYYATIAELVTANPPDGTAVGFLHKPITSTGTDPTYGNYFVIGEDAAPETLKTYYSHAVTTTDRVRDVTGQINTQGSNRVLDVDGGPGYDPQGYVGYARTVTSGTIAWARTFADWTTLPTDGRQYALENKHIAWCDGASVYLEEPDRSSGILLSTGILPPSDGPYLANVRGTINTNSDGERVIDVSFITYTAATSSVKPLGMNNRSIEMGLSPTGLLTRVWGRVTATDDINGYVYVDDGSALKDGTSTGTEENVGIRVLFNDTYFPAVGDYALVTGPLGRRYDYNQSISVNCVRTRGLLDVALSPPPTPTGLEAAGGNAVVMLAWDAMNAAEFRVYRSSSESGQYAIVGTSTSQAYTDSPVTNGITYWYKIAAVNNEESPQTNPVSATPTGLAPTVSVNNASVDGNGLLTLQCSGSSGQAGYTLMVDGDIVWTFSQSEIGSIVYDTTQLPNGPHAFAIQASSGEYQGVASTNLNIQNFISEFNVPDDMCGLQSISAKFQESTSWTLTVNQYGSPIYSTSGSGTSMDVSWNAGTTYGEFDVTLSASGRSRTLKSRKDNSSHGGDYYAWASIYVADNDPLMEGNYRYMHQAASAALQAKYGVSIYSGRLNSDSTWQDVVIDTILNGDIPANHLAVASHGTVPVTSHNPPWQGLLVGKFPGSGYLQGSGLTAFKDINPFLRPPGSSYFIPVGPEIGNTLNWDLTKGRVSDWRCTRRLRFVYVGACSAGQGVFSLAFGTPRGRYPGRGRAFLSFKDKIGGGRAQMFSEKFWNEWKKNGVTVAQAATRAFWHVLNQQNYRTNYVLHGDPNLLIK
ncbi:MAG: hypothetical protein A2Z18_07940 [Armatimonadetes bacterium RBG_16_58_9]|nr:MAG: hypothetical protein A2Z18_07940 [Armatimonadetes bacterium RBG_16_58_9]